MTGGITDATAKSARVFHKDASAAYYAPPGRLVIVTADARALVAAFDAKSLAIRGELTPVLDCVSIPTNVPYMAIASSGTLAMRRGSAPTGGDFDLVWIDRRGRESIVDSSFTFRVTLTAGNFGWELAISPDGHWMAYQSDESGRPEVFVRRSRTRTTRRNSSRAAAAALRSGRAMGANCSTCAATP